MADFTHLHVHTQYSILDGACNINKLVTKAKDLGMDSLAITDHGVMYGVLDFKNTCDKAGIKPILGCEMYVSPNDMYVKDPKIKDNHLILLAKNFTGYQNLIKLDSLAFDPKAFYKHARIDKKLLFEHSEGLICSSACVAGIIPRLLYEGKVEEAERTAMEYKEVFKDDYYIELQNHKINEIQQDVTPKLIALARKLNIKLIATNDVHFINKEDFYAHKILLCISTGKKIDEPTKLVYTGEEYMKSGDEMAELFKGVPEAIANTREVADKIETYVLERPPILPVFDIPESFGKLEDYYVKYSEQDIKDKIYEGLKKRNEISETATEEEKKEIVEKTIKKKGGYDKLVHTEFDFAYLKYLTLEGAKKRYGEPLSQEVQERLDLELDTIEWMGFPGYFLIVQDFINYSRDHLGVTVGPGRGSAAGSVVAYCLGITQMEPLKYDLLFERFLNPDRISLPDIDVDFDDEGRERTLHYVQQKYGVTHVAQIITFGTMAAKNSIKDVARVLGLPLSDSNRIAGYIPNEMKMTITKALAQSPELQKVRDNGTELEQKVLKYAIELEGSIRNTGVHACGVIIGPDDISNFVPLTMPKDSTMMATQFEGTLVESVGMIKMDFLGLSNLSIIKDACENIYKSTGKRIEIDKISLDDKETLELFARGDTTATFQFESPGMKKYLAELKPDKFEDLIAMNALYRPGPLQYIPDFINRKNGRSTISYDLPQMEQYLSDTYGITVYQEQVMQLSRLLANFTRGQADKLRKAMGKKKIDQMKELKEKFDTGCAKNGLDKKITDKIWHDWEEFAKYAFNKSHSTCYAYVAFQTGYLKAHYTAEYMSAVLTHNLNDIKKITPYIEDCLKHDIEVLGPNVNESDVNFMVNKKHQILFGLAGIKGVGADVSLSIIKERNENGAYKSAEDFIMRNPSANRKCIESLVKSGAFDCFQGIDRAQYLAPVDGNADSMFIEKIIRYCNKKRENDNASQISLFGEEDSSNEIEIEYPQCEPMPLLERLRYEQEMIGFYISGHPLDQYADEIKCFAHDKLSELDNIDELIRKQHTTLSFAGIITSAGESVNNYNKRLGQFVLEDKESSHKFYLNGKTLLEFGKFLQKDLFVLVKGRIEEYTTKDNISKASFRVDRIELLDSLFDTYATGIKIDIEKDKLDKEFVENITTIAKRDKGQAVITFCIFEPQDNMRVTLESRKHKINVSTFIKDIKPLIHKNQISSYSVNVRTMYQR